MGWPSLAGGLAPAAPLVPTSLSGSSVHLQLPPKRDETALQEEEELQLAIALSQSEAEEKERMVRALCGGEGGFAVLRRRLWAWLDINIAFVVAMAGFMPGGAHAPAPAPEQE